MASTCEVPAQKSDRSLGPIDSLYPSPSHLETAGSVSMETACFLKTVSEYSMRTEVAERKSISRLLEGQQQTDIHLSLGPAVGGLSILVALYQASLQPVMEGHAQGRGHRHPII